MKKSILILLAIIGIIAYLFINQSNNTINVELRDFAIEDTSSITKLYFADRKGNDVTLERSANGWLVNGKYSARKDAIITTLSTIKNLAVKYPVSEALHNRIIKNLATNATKVEIFTNDKEKAFKTYYVGGEPQDLIGSYMLMENSSKAFLVYIPGFNGFLAPRYNVDGSTVKSMLWRDRSIFSYNKDSIKSVEVTYHEDTIKNYKLTKDDKEYTLKAQNKNGTLDNVFGDAYFNLFKNINCEGFSNNMSFKDSILNSPPFRTIKVQENNGKTKTLIAYHKGPERAEYQNAYGDKLEYDVDRMFGKVEEDFMLIQFYVFDKIFLDIDKVSVEK
jgi:hypothetical protein